MKYETKSGGIDTALFIKKRKRLRWGGGASYEPITRNVRYESASSRHEKAVKQQGNRGGEGGWGAVEWRNQWRQWWRAFGASEPLPNNAIKTTLTRSKTDYKRSPVKSMTSTFGGGGGGEPFFRMIRSGVANHQLHHRSIGQSWSNHSKGKPKLSAPHARPGGWSPGRRRDTATIHRTSSSLLFSLFLRSPRQSPILQDGIRCQESLAPRV